MEEEGIHSIQYDTAVIVMLVGVLQANKHAVTTLQNGDHDQAMECFRQALQGLKQCIINVEHLSKEQDSNGCPNNCRANVDAERCGDKARGDAERRGDDARGDDEKDKDEDRDSNLKIEFVPLVSSESLDDERTTSPMNHFFLYSRAVVLWTPDDDIDATHPCKESMKNYTLLSSVLLFNMALSLHRKGLVPPAGNSSNKNFRTSLRLYDMIAGLHTGDNGGDLPHVIKLAVWNNIGHITSHVGDQERATHCRAQLSQALLQDQSSTQLTTEEYAFFYLSTLCLVVRRCITNSSQIHT